MHITVHPPILYFGTPVVLLGTVNDDGTPNLAPASSVFWLGWRCFLGLQSRSQTAGNARRTGQITINLPCAEQVQAVDRLALTTGADPVPRDKSRRGYRFVKDKFGLAGLSALAAETVSAPRVAECPVQLEAVLEHQHGCDEGGPWAGAITVLEARVTRVHVERSILMDGHADRIDPDKWRPLIMSFQEYYGLGAKLHPSRLGQIPEGAYRTPDFERARAAHRP
jgi:flavin reductase (DIM6/NTAB) family NADH-FMN oxidoreductase RutF